MATGIVLPSSSVRELLVKNPAVTNVVVAAINTEQSISLAGNTDSVAAVNWKEFQ